MTNEKLKLKYIPHDTL